MERARCSAGSGWRARAPSSQAGYTPADAVRLIDDIRAQLLPLDAVFEENTEYGNKYHLTGPNGRRLKVVSIWMTEASGGVTKFITLYPGKEN